MFAKVVLVSIISLISNKAMAQITVSFDEYPVPPITNDSTRIIDSEYVTGGADNTNSPLPPGAGFSVSTVGGINNTGDVTLYNTNLTGGNDPDLDGINIGNVLISQETGNLTGDGTGDGPGPGYSPDDSIAATVTLSFERSLTAFGSCVVGPIVATDLGISNIQEFQIDYDSSGGLGELQIFLNDGHISGNVSEDTTGNGLGDTPIAGVSLQLFSDPNGDGNPNDGVLLDTQLTDASGDYVFDNVPFGDYVVVESQPAGLDSM